LNKVARENFQRVAFFVKGKHPFVASITLDKVWVMVYNQRTRTLRGIPLSFRADDLEFDEFGKLTMSNHLQSLTICTKCWLDGDCRCPQSPKKAN